MALVIKSAPGNDSSLANEMLFVIHEATKTADPITYPDYRYVLDVYVDSVFVGRQKVRPRPDNKMGVFDISVILRNYVTYGLNISSELVDYTLKLNYQIKLGEEYGDTLYTNLVTDIAREAVKTYGVRPFTTSAILSNGLASNMPATVNYHRDQLIHLLPYYSNVSGITNIDQKFYDSGNNLLQTDTINNSTYAARTIRQANILSGLSGPVPPESATYALITGAGINLQVNYLCESKFDALTLAWLNPFGGYESQSFGLVSKKSIEIERKDYKQQNYNINASGEVSYDANNVYYGGKKGYATTAKIKMMLTSHLLSDDEYQWLADLFMSPDVYLYDAEQAKFHPVTIAETNYEYRTYKNSRLTTLQFTVEYSDQYNAQYL